MDCSLAHTSYTEKNKKNRGNMCAVAYILAAFQQYDAEKADRPYKTVCNA